MPLVFIPQNRKQHFRLSFTQPLLLSFDFIILFCVDFLYILLPKNIYKWIYVYFSFCFAIKCVYVRRLHSEGLAFFIFGTAFAVRACVFVCVSLFSFVFALILVFNIFRLNLAFDNNFHSFQCLHFLFHSIPRNFRLMLLLASMVLYEFCLPKSFLCVRVFVIIKAFGFSTHSVQTSEFQFHS